MPRFAFIYRGGKPPEDGKAHMAKWRAWRDSLEDAYVCPGMPFSAALTVAAGGTVQGSGAVALAGVSIVEAKDIEAARSMAERCPHLDLGGDIVVAQGMNMEM